MADLADLSFSALTVWLYQDVLVESCILFGRSLHLAQSHGQRLGASADKELLLTP